MTIQAKLALVTLRAPKNDPGSVAITRGLPWSCWDKREISHPGTYNADAAAIDSGNGFRERGGQTQVAEGSYLLGSWLQDGSRWVS